MRFFSNLKGDFCGGVSAAAITLPQCIGYGLIAFSAIGPGFASNAAALGMFSAIFAGLVAAAFGGSSIQITGPKAPLTLISASLVAALASSTYIPQASPVREALIVGLVSLTVLMGGVFQVILGFLALGNLVKYVPSPVISGFLNGVGFILIEGQIRVLLGLHTKDPFITLLSTSARIQPLVLATGMVSVLTVFVSKRFFKSLPSSLTAMFAGCAFYYSIAPFVDPSHLGPTMGSIGGQWPKPYVFVELFRAADTKLLLDLLPQLLVSGFLLALVGSTESLLSCAASDTLTGIRHRSDRELVGQGMGNMLSSLFGSIFAAGSVPRTMTNFEFGGRTRLSGILCSLTLLFTILFLGPVIEKIPMAVVAGLIISVGISMFDARIIRLTQKKVARMKPKGLSTLWHERSVLIDLIVMLTVAVVTVAISLMLAVGLGIALTSALFIAKMGKSIIRRRFFGDHVHSKKMRSEAQTELLEDHGRKIVVFELQGALFFGAVESLAIEIETLTPRISYCILDFRRVNEIDSTGAGIILHLQRYLIQHGKTLLLSHLGENHPSRTFLEDMEVVQVVGENSFFPDTDAALEWAENHMLLSLCPLGDGCAEVPFERMEIVHGFSTDELDLFKSILVTELYKKGDLIIGDGDQAKDLYLLRKGCVSVRIRLQETGRLKRLYTFSSGAVFGEMALLDGKSRSADVWAEEDCEVLKLTFEEYISLIEQFPQIAVKLIQNLAKTLSLHVRRASIEIKILEDS